MAENKTQPTKDSAADFLAKVTNEKRRADALEVFGMMKDITSDEPVMWGTSMIGFGSYHYKGKSGREGDWLTIGLSPRSNALTVYGLIYYDENRDMLEKLGGCTAGKGCIYIKDLDKVNKDVLRDMIKESYSKNNGRLFDYATQ